jgi:hypothetical protein
MTGTEFMEVWNDTELRQYLVNVAKAFTRDKALQEDLLQEAWLRISQEDRDKTCDYYKSQGFKGMDMAYRKERRNMRLEKWGKQHRKIADRVRYIEKKSN